MKVRFNAFHSVLTTTAILFAMSTYSFADGVRTQKSVAIEGVRDYLWTWPEFRIENLMHFFQGDDFSFFKKMHSEKPESSPFRVFGAQQAKRKPSQGWSLAFQNDAASFETMIRRDYGLCAGFTSTHRSFNMLAFFDSKNAYGQIVPDRKTDEDAWLSFMKERVDGIMDHRMQVIPGFKDLQQFSSDPMIAQYLKEKMIEEWKRVSVTLGQGYFQGLRGAHQSMSASEKASLRNELREKLDLGFNPIVYLQEGKKEGEKYWIHVLQVTEVSEPKADGSFFLTVWDVNHSDAKDAKKKVQFDAARGEIYFEDFTLTKVTPLLWDDLEIADMIKKNLNFCADHPGLCTEGLAKFAPPKPSLPKVPKACKDLLVAQE